MALISTQKPSILSEDVQEDFLKLGGEGIAKCYQCGTCTAICPNSEQQTVRVRRMIKRIQLGMKNSILGDPTPWTCYFCGDCNATCPKEANPGFIMDSARKYQIINYSVGKLGKLFYDKVYAALALVMMSAVAIFGITTWPSNLSGLNFKEVDIYSFMSSELIHEIGLWLLAYVVLVTLINVISMYRYTKNTIGIGKSTKISNWLRELINVIIREGLFQLRLKCQKGNNYRYLAHLSIFWGFVLTFAATGTHFMWLILYPEAKEPSYVTNIARILGIIGGVLLIYGSIYYIVHRAKRDEEYAKRSFLPDWWLLSLIIIIGVTGFFTTIGIYANIPLLTYASYGLHLLSVFYLIVSAPFSKLAHLVYRTLALWFSKVWEGEL